MTLSTAEQRQKIIESVFSRRNAAGNLEETYIAHIKIWEDAGPEGGGRKPRYILLSQSHNGSGFIHKSKLNTNGTFSVGKTWRLPEMRAISVTGPMSFNITLSRTYRWQTENEQEQETFLHAIVQLFQNVTGGAALRVEGLANGESGRQRIQNDYMKSAHPPSPNGFSSSTKLKSQQSSLGTEPQQRIPSPTVRPASPAGSTLSSRTTASRVREPSATRARPISPAQSMNGSSPRKRPSNPDSSRITNGTASAPPPPPILKANVSYASSHNDGSSILPPSESSSLRSRPPSPSPSVRSRKQPVRTATALSTNDPSRRDQNARISFFDPANQSAIDRLISSSDDIDGDEENAQATMTSVEEMIEGYEWASDDIINRKTPRGAADLIEARLLDELMALEKANIHSFLESDDRINLVLQFMDGAISELDNIGSLVSTYKIHLNAVGDDISYIQSQNRGLQVQTQNQRALLAELENLVQTVHVDTDVLLVLTQESLEKSPSIQRLEEASAELYKALLAGRDMDMAATMERLQEYRTHNSQFCKRIFDFLSIMFTAQSKLLLGENDGLTKADKNRKPTIVPHSEWETYLGRYSGLMLYLKEMDEGVYGKLCAAYFSAASELHGTQVKALFSTYISFVRKASEDAQGDTFSNITPTTSKASGMRRAGTIIRSPLDGRNKDKDRGPDGDMRASEVFTLVLEQIAPVIQREDEFLADFLQINDVALTFADYMGLDNYFRRQASRSAGLSSATMKLVRGALELIFGFLPTELKSWLDSALERDNMQIVGLIASLERFLADADEGSNNILLDALGRQHTRLKGLFDRHINEQIQVVEQTKLTSKKRRGVAPFIKRFPAYISRVESQMLSADGLEIRMSVDGAYERIVDTMFESLKQMAKMDGEGEDKGQLNYHVILIENMHHFVAETSQMEIGSVASFVKKAEAIYDENLNAYVKIVLRRPFSKIIDFFEGVERLLKTTAASEVSSNSNYNRSALKKVIKEYNAKDVRKHVDSLFKRVEKHFTEASEKTTEEGKGILPGTVMVGVWKACQDELLRITELFSKRITQCYSETGVSLEYSTTDVEAAFRRHTIAS
ncbi:exocyst complex component sec3 subunit [Dendrothele bispora CBS 962.96]|uniref:Exocyst complex component sec3 subunit n=1 Tax=Dendrothele bispora (strain CBS 962.96) TaxID=1314807 RepID=A0A4S8MTJ7_DENBC|nr:exocyst complex component sec3 subunit [Dendrothele bispora CBS 962.96]